MGGLVRGDIVIVPFPFSDLSGGKHRPALVIACASDKDYILCQITTKIIRDKWAIEVDREEAIKVSLRKRSYIRTNKLFTLEGGIISERIGEINPDLLQQTINKVTELINAG